MEINPGTVSDLQIGSCFVRPHDAEVQVSASPGNLFVVCQPSNAKEAQTVELDEGGAE